MTPVFLSPFLLFVLELMAGKNYLMRFGSSSSVWISLMIFFTTSLFLGYVYAALISPKIHISIIICVSLYCLYQIVVFGTLFPSLFTFANPNMNILLNAVTHMGFSVVILSSTSVLLPLWSNKANPYKYYSVSNIGSLIGLLSYPILIEPYVSIKYQQISWVALFLLNSWLITNAIKKPIYKNQKQQLRFSQFLAPVIYSSLSTAYFLVTTATISQAIGPFPLLWAISMAIYLVSFVVAISYHKIVQFSFHLPLALFFLLVTVAISTRQLFLGNVFEYIWLLATQFIVNVVINTKLYYIRPQKNELAAYYIAIAFGGAMASMLIGVLAPLSLSQFQEFPIIIAICCILFAGIAVIAFKKKIIAIQFVFICFLSLIWIWYVYTKVPPVQPGLSVVQSKSRNFYGFITIVDFIKNNNILERRLLSGKTIHGLQLFGGASEYEPTTYYNRYTALGFLFKRPITNVGIIGLGAGTIAGYCQPNSHFTFYEINPDVINIAKNKFTYLNGCLKKGGTFSLVEGDARISLTKEPKHAFDILVVDAFTDDAIPTHLLTKEALSLYFSHLKSGGVVALHISSKYLDLKPVAVVTANSLGLYSASHATPDASYILLSRSPLNIGNPESASSYPNIKPWTDNYTNIIQAIKW